jgi:hypothetical protein
MVFQFIFSSAFPFCKKLSSLSPFLSVGAERDRSLDTSATVGPTVPAPNDDDDTYECGAIGGMKISRCT